MRPVGAEFGVTCGGRQFAGFRLVQLGGFEPPTSGSTIRRSNQLSYNCIPVERGNLVAAPSKIKAFRALRAETSGALSCGYETLASLWFGGGGRARRGTSGPRRSCFRGTFTRPDRARRRARRADIHHCRAGALHIVPGAGHDGERRDPGEPARLERAAACVRQGAARRRES